RDDGRQVARQAIDLEVDAVDLPVQAVDLALQTIEFVLQAIHPGLDGGQIVTVVPGLIEDMTGHQLLALDLALNNVDAHRELRELVPGHGFGHCDLLPQSFRSKSSTRRDVYQCPWPSIG